jgi:signal transduction histidine kinase
VTTDRRAIPLDSPIELGPQERRLEVRFTAPTFVRTEGARFRHRLIGYDPDWVETGNGRSAQYGPIPPGHYTLTIAAANGDGVWNAEAVSLAIDVRPSWWQTRWFEAGSAAAVVLLFAGAYRRRVSALERRRRDQEAFARRLIESQEAERKRIANELHDGIGQTLAVIRNRALLGLRDGGAPGLVQQMSEISTVAADAIDEVRKVSYGLRPYQIDRLGLTRALEALVEQAAASGVPIAGAIANIDGWVAKGDEINVYRIVQEAVSNLIRHARATSGRVAVAPQGAEIEIRVEDNGVGFDPPTVAGAGGLGLAGVAERARILGGRAIVRSSPGEGTLVLVVIPGRRR